MSAVRWLRVSYWAGAIADALAAVAMLIDLKKQEAARPGTGGSLLSAMTGASQSSTDFDSRFLSDSGDDCEDESDEDGDEIFAQLHGAALAAGRFCIAVAALNFLFVTTTRWHGLLRVLRGEGS